MIRTGYSFHTAVGSLDDVLARIQEIGWKHAPVCDRLSTFGFQRWSKKTKEAQIKPVFGVEIPVVSELGQKKPIEDHWRFFAKDSLRPLHDLIWQATKNPGKAPSLTYAQALRQEGVFVIAGPRLLVDSLTAFPPHFYGALGPSSSPGLVRRMIAAGMPLVATSDNYFPAESDRELYRIALGMRRANNQTYPQHIMSDEELNVYLNDDYDDELIASGFVNRDRILDECSVELKQARLLVPEKPKSLRVMCEEGAKQKNVNLDDPAYAERLNKELSVIKEKDFEDYFYILTDIISFAKARMVVGPARGSSCGSLVCYLLGITTVDPLPYGLIFERFIDVNRADLPDVDIDFSDANRDLVFDYAEQKFGKERVARLGTVGMFQAKSSLNASAISLKVPQWEINNLADSIIIRQAGDARVHKTLEDTFDLTDKGIDFISRYPEMRIACRIEGHPQNASQHAAGLLLTADPINEFVAVNARSRGAWCDKKDAEALNLLKIDALGLTQLSIFERTLELIGEKPVSGWLETIPLDDPSAFEVINKGKSSGVFQMAGGTVKGLAAKVKVDKLDDLIALSAIARPGSMDSGGADDWVRRRNGEPVPQIHPILDRITAETYGVLVYQEQVMFICRELAGMSWPETGIVRKLISDRKGAEALSVWEKRFVEGATQQGLSEHEAKNIWDGIVTFGRYGFNKSHAVAYGIISYWCCWLKAHHPLAFAAATLDAEADVNKQIAILRELHNEGVGYIPVDVEKSTDRWTIDGNTLIGPITTIKGIGPAKVQEILNSRTNGEKLKPGVLKKLKEAKTQIDSIFPVQDRIKELYPDLKEINILSEPTKVADIQPGINGSFVALVKINNIKHKDENSEEMVEKRGYQVSGPSKSINLFVSDDTDEIFAKINRHKAVSIVEPETGLTFAKKFTSKAKAGKSLYAIKGTCPPDFRMISIDMMRFLGEIE
jgi:DNA polymerase III alpha subunit